MAPKIDSQDFLSVAAKKLRTKDLVIMSTKEWEKVERILRDPLNPPSTILLPRIVKVKVGSDDGK